MAIRVELELEDGSFTTRMIHASESVAQFRNNVGQGITSVNKLNESTFTLLGTMRDITVTLGMARAAFENIRAITTGWAGDIIKINADMEKLTTLLKGMSNAAKPLEDAGNSVKFLREQAVLAPFSLSALTDTFVKMKATGIDPMKGAFKSMVDSVAAFGGTDDVLKRATIAITQMSGKGVIQMEELRQQLGEAVPRAVELMARSMGVSTGQLVQIISKGTLDAKTSLKALNTEFDLTFGGAAQAQMRTFNGMMTQTTSLMQSLALDAGKAGFFDAVKKQLTDLNIALAGPMASNFASNLGGGLASIVGYLRDGVEWVIRFRQEIITAGTALAAAFSTKIAIGAISSLMGVFAGITNEVRIFNVAWSNMTNTMQMASFGQQIGQMGLQLNGVTQGISRTTQVTRTAASMLPMLAVGFATVAGTVVPLTLVIVGLAMAFGLFSNKAKDAYEDLVKFGAQSRKQAEEANGYLKQEEAILKAMKAQRATNQGFDSGPELASDSDVLTQERKVQEIREKMVVGNVDAIKRDAEVIARAQQESLDDEVTRSKAAYDEIQKAKQLQYADDLKKVQENRGDNKAVTAAFAEDKRKSDIEQFTVEYNILRDRLEALTALRSEGDDAAGLIYDKTAAKYRSEMVAKLDARNTLAASAMGPQRAPKLDDIDALIGKAENKLEDMKAEISGVRAELAGASGEYAKLAYMINEAQAKGNYTGPLSNQKIKETTDALLEQQKVFDALTAKKNGQDKLSADLERINTKAHQDLIDTQTDGMTESEKLAFKLKAGLYDGQTAMQRLTMKWGEVSFAATTAGDDMRKALDSLNNPTAGALSFLDKVKMGFSGLVAARSGAGAGINLPNITSGNSLTDRIISGESNGNNFASNPNSSAKGAGQFIESTWLEFLKKMHPDMLKSGRDAALALRSDGALSRQATDWYQGENASLFAKNNIPANDANLKLGHFLGGGGATAALTSGDDTLVRSIPALTQAILKNYDVFKNISTVGDLKGWAARQVGGGSTYKPDALTPSQKLSFDETQALEKQNQALIAKKKLTAAEKAYLDGVVENAEADAGKLSNFAAIRAKIAGGKGPDGEKNKDIEDPKYDALYDAAKKKDASDEFYSQKKINRTKLEAIESRQASDADILALKDEELQTRLDFDQKFKRSGEYWARERAYRKEVIEIDKAVGLGNKTPAEGDALKAKAFSLTQDFANKDVVVAVKAEQEKTRAIENSLLTVGEQRDKQLSDDIKRNEGHLAAYVGEGEGRVQIERQVMRTITALRRQAFDATPFGKMIKDFGDINNNFQVTAVGWMSGFNDKLTDLAIKGKADWKSMTDSWLSDLIKVGLKAAQSKLWSSLLGGDFMGASSTGGASLPGMNSFIGPVATNHSGGIAGSGRSPTMNIDYSAFIGAPRFHTGSKGMTLGGDEIPIIAMKGEQTDWPENLAKQYGGDNIKQSNQFNVTVNGSAGTPTQNDDLAAKIGAQLQDSARAMVAKEIRTQLKPGGILK